MKVKSQLYRVLLVAAIIILLSTFVGCNRNPSGNPDDKPITATSEPTSPEPDKGQPTHVEQNDNTSTASPTATDNPTAAVTDGPVITDEPDDDDDPDDAPDITPSVGDDDEDDDDPDDPVSPSPDELTPEDILRTESWNETFLIWIPEFTEGIYTGTTAEETEDIALFTNVGASEVREYIELLKEKGFIHNVETRDDVNGIIYDACNEENWWVNVNYLNGNLSVGSGYRVDRTDDSEKLDTLWTTTLLGLLPHFEEGSLAGSGTESRDTVYVLFEEVTEDYIRTYIDALAETGFDVDADEGDQDGFIWYSAENKDENICDLTYYDGSVKISVSK